MTVSILPARGLVDWADSARAVHLFPWLNAAIAMKMKMASPVVYRLRKRRSIDFDGKGTLTNLFSYRGGNFDHSMLPHMKTF